MIKYSAKHLIERAKALADLNNSSFISWGDNFQMLNSIYREVYQDMIQQGDLFYIQKVRLATTKSAKFKLPDDFYQIAMLADDFGNEIPLKRLASTNDRGYEITNDTIALYNTGNCTLSYYPIPETITYKQPRTDNITIEATPVSGYNNIVLLSDGRLFNIADQDYVNSLTFPTTSILGKDTLVNVANGSVYYLDSTTVVNTILRPTITSSGYISEGEYGNYSFTNDDKSAVFYVDENGSYFTDGKNTIELDGTLSYDTKVLYWNGKWAAVTRNKILYADGSWETTDSYNVTALLKCDYNTGYGYVVKTGTTSYAIEGWTPDTIIDYPNNLLFDIVAYKLAIQYRMKQNSDSSSLQVQVDNLLKTYYSSISSDKDFPVIRNTDSYYRFGWY